MDELIVIEIAKAAKCYEDQYLPDATLKLSGEPHPDLSMNDFNDYYKNQAQEIMKVLKWLPGATIDRLLILLLQSKACLLKVPMDRLGEVLEDLDEQNGN